MLLAALVVIACAFASSADAYVYWANGSGDTIGRAPLADPNGPGKNQSFITGAHGPNFVAVDGAHIYWTNGNTGTIGRANLDGSGVDQSYVTGASAPFGVAVNGTHIYWANRALGVESIGRAPLADPNGPGKDQSIIDHPSQAEAPVGVAVDGGHIWWGNFDVDAIGRANLSDGLVPLGGQSFIDLTVGSDVAGVAVDGAHVYWASNGLGTIGRANLDGTGVDESFVTGANGPFGVAVDADPASPPSNGFSLGKLKQNKKKGTATLTVDVPGPGALELAGEGLKPATADASAAGEVILPLKAAGKSKKRLKKKGKVKLTAQVTFTPTGGSANTLPDKVKLVRKKKK